MNANEILDLIDSGAPTRLVAPVVAEALAALPPGEVEGARRAAVERGLARLPEEQRARHAELGLEPTDLEILTTLEDPAIEMELVAQRVALRMHLARVEEIEATARAIAAVPGPASTALNRILTRMPWFVVAMARLLRARRDEDPRAPRSVILRGGRLVPDAFRAPAGSVLAVLRRGAEAYGPVGALDEILPALQEGDGAHVFAGVDAPRAGDLVVWDIPTCLRCVLELEHAHDDLMGRFAEALSRGDEGAAAAAWEALPREDQEWARASLGGPRPDLGAIRAGLAAGILDVDQAADALSRWICFAPAEEIAAGIAELIEGIEDPHDATTTAGRLQAELSRRKMFVVGMTRLHRERAARAERARQEARAQDPRVARIVDRVEACLAGDPGPEEERALAAELAALDDASCALAMRAWRGEDLAGIDEVVEEVRTCLDEDSDEATGASEEAPGEGSWDAYRDAILTQAALRPIDEARRVVAAIPGETIPDLQGKPLWRVVVNRIKAGTAGEGA